MVNYQQLDNTRLDRRGKQEADSVKKKWWKMRAYAFLLASLLALALLPAAGRAVLSDVYFTAVNEQLLDLSSETMPFWSDGVLYVSSREIGRAHV